MLSRVNNGEESTYPTSVYAIKNDRASPMASVLTPLKGVSKQDCMASA